MSFLSSRSARSVCPLALAAGTLLTLAAVASAQSTAPTLPNGVAAGDTTQTSGVIWTRSTATGQLNYQVSTDPNFNSLVASGSTTVADPTIPFSTNISGLSAGTQYYYRFTDAAANSLTGQFRTSVAQGTRTGLHFGVSGDWRGENAPFPFNRNAPSANLDFWVSLGDTIYADVATPVNTSGQARTLSQFRAMHNEVLSTHSGMNTFADLRRTTSTFAVIDDHEVTNDFAGYNTVGNDPRFAEPGLSPTTRLNRSPLYQNGLQAFQEYHPMNRETWNTPGNDRMDGLPSLYRHRTFGSAASLTILDARSFRDTEIPGPANPLDPAQVTAFIGQTFTPGRTMLGVPQLNQLQSDLMASYTRGETWRFVVLPEPVQNLGVVGAGDRYEGYAAERAQLLNYIRTNNIPNVVFITADIHGTVVNNLTAPAFPGGPQLQTGAWEISTGSGAYDAPFGPTVAGIAASLGLPGTISLSDYFSLPAAQQEAYVQGLINQQVVPLGYDPVGLQGSPINASLLAGTWTATNTYGWTDFSIDEATQNLLVTTYGIPWYTDAQLAAAIALDPNYLNTLQPVIVQQISIVPQFVPTPGAAGLLALGGLFAVRRRR